MPARLLYLMMLLSLCSWLAGCLPAGEGQSDEQSNPHYRVGKEKLGAFDYKGAVESFERALEDNPRSVLAHFELGVLYEQQEHDYAAALYHYGKALKLRPSGYPSDHCGQRIRACRQELVKADSLATINPNMLDELQALRATNQWLVRELGLARSQLGGAGPASSGKGPLAPSGERSASFAGGSTGGTSGHSAPNYSGNVASRPQPPGSALTQSAGPARGNRTYTVKSGDTAAAIARLHGIRLDALLNANPGLRPKQMRAGQMIVIPGS